MSEPSLIMGAPGATATLDGLLTSSPVVSDEDRNRLIAASAAEMQGKLGPFLETCLRIRTDPGLSPKGLRECLDNALEAFNASMDAVAASKQVDGWAMRHKFLTAKIGNPFAPLRGGNIPGSEETRALVYRELEKEGGDILISGMLHDAIASKDVRILAAIVDAPPQFAILNPKLIDQAEESYRRKLFPSETAERDEIEATLSLIRFNGAAAKRAARKLADRPASSLRLLKL